MGSDSELITQIYKMKCHVYLIKCLVVLMGVAVVPVTPASILAVTSPNRARQLSKIIGYRKSVEVDSLTNNVRQFITLQNYLNNNLHEKVQLQDLAEAVVNGLTTAYMGKGVAAKGLLAVLQLFVGRAAALVPEDLVVWFLGRELLVSDVVIVETIIEELFAVYAAWLSQFKFSMISWLSQSIHASS